MESLVSRFGFRLGLAVAAGLLVFTAWTWAGCVRLKSQPPPADAAPPYAQMVAVGWQP